MPCTDGSRLSDCTAASSSASVTAAGSKRSTRDAMPTAAAVDVFRWTYRSARRSVHANTTARHGRAKAPSPRAGNASSACRTRSHTPCAADTPSNGVAARPMGDEGTGSPPACVANMRNRVWSRHAGHAPAARARERSDARRTLRPLRADDDDDDDGGGARAQNDATAKQAVRRVLCRAASIIRAHTRRGPAARRGAVRAGKVRSWCHRACAVRTDLSELCFRPHISCPRPTMHTTPIIHDRS